MRPLLLSIAALALAACADYSPSGGAYPAAPVLTTVTLSLEVTAAEPGQQTAATATTLDQFGAAIAAGPVTFTSSAIEVAGVNPTTGAILAVGEGTTEITATVGGLSASKRLTVTKAPIRINEIVPDGDRPGGFVELYNPTDADIDMADWQIGSDNLAALFRIPAGAKILAHGFLVVNEVTLPFGLKPRDGVHLFSRFGVQVDSYSWLEDLGTGFARCPDGTGPLVVEQAAPTRRAANECS
jgi:hypothetical protein